MHKNYQFNKKLLFQTVEMIFAYKNQETDTLEKSFGKKGRRGSGKKARVVKIF